MPLVVIGGLLGFVIGLLWLALEDLSVIKKTLKNLEDRKQ